MRAPREIAAARSHVKGGAVVVHIEGVHLSSSNSLLLYLLYAAAVLDDLYYSSIRVGIVCNIIILSICFRKPAFPISTPQRLNIKPPPLVAIKHVAIGDSKFGRLMKVDAIYGQIGMRAQGGEMKKSIGEETCK